MEPQLEVRLTALEKKLDATYESAEKTRKYFVGTMIATGVGILLPLIALLFTLPSIISSYGSMLSIQ